MESNINWQARYNELQDAYMKERAGLQAKCERYEMALKDIASGKALPQLIAQQALSAGEGEKEELCTMCNEKPKGEGLLVCDDCYKAFDGDRRGFWTSDNYQ